MSRPIIEPVLRSKNPPLLVFPPMPPPELRDLMKFFRDCRIYDEYFFLAAGAIPAGLRSRRIVVMPWAEACRSREDHDRMRKWLIESVYTTATPGAQVIEL